MKHKHIELTAMARPMPRRKRRRRGTAGRVLIASRHHRSETAAKIAV